MLPVEGHAQCNLPARVQADEMGNGFTQDACSYVLKGGQQHFAALCAAAAAMWPTLLGWW